ncbi:hypothetical protein J2S13_001692 [Oikeobacillus pervagus]|uniref:FHA domain-containing protein n=1 Tax=Oikeobacillus pervagus TaxID=1325931 RepID=A0AAJ1T169_9BACI|nr:FHA domain-containing protein [Oikeobacillus pervagus]MDQ0215292.1 hypothetical protein [Oikeobacillus pervagus]
MNEVRVCDLCHHHNESHSLICENCGEDISFIPSTIIRKERFVQNNENPEVSELLQGEDEPSTTQKTARLIEAKLINVLSGYTVILPPEGGVLGRSGTIDPRHFQKNRFVSNQHARFSLSGDEFIVQDLNSTNGTKLNGVRLSPDREYPLQEGDKLTFANMEFLFEK